MRALLLLSIAWSARAAWTDNRGGSSKSIDTGVGESYTCWEGVDMEGMELGGFTPLDVHETWADCKKKCSKRGNCIGVVFKNSRTRGGCQEYSSLRKFKRPGFSGPSTACIKMKLPNVRPFSLAAEPPGASDPHVAHLQALAASAAFLLIVAGLAFAAATVGAARLSRKSHGFSLPPDTLSADPHLFVAGRAVS